ncbi:hypothetical protein C8R46DRAFT_1038867 [Mycena filopes]|nr:hypothetical protein C8R46DRAFT_1038867 [Mycena filopes]
MVKDQGKRGEVKWGQFGRDLCDRRGSSFQQPATCQTVSATAKISSFVESPSFPPESETEAQLLEPHHKRSPGRFEFYKSMADSGASAPSGSSKTVICKCTAKCGGPDGAGKPVGYSTRTLHRRTDANNLGIGAEFTSFLSGASAAANNPPSAPGGKRRLPDDQTVSHSASKRRHEVIQATPDPNLAIQAVWMNWNGQSGRPPQHFVHLHPPKIPWNCGPPW